MVRNDFRHGGASCVGRPPGIRVSLLVGRVRTREPDAAEGRCTRRFLLGALLEGHAFAVVDQWCGSGPGAAAVIGVPKAVAAPVVEYTDMANEFDKNDRG